MVALIILTLQFNVKCKKSFVQDLNLVVLFYFDIMQSINVNPGLSFSARCSLACPSIFTFQSVKMHVQAKSRIYIYTLH